MQLFLLQSETIAILNKKRRTLLRARPNFLVAGAGFEPATFGL